MMSEIKTTIYDIFGYLLPGFFSFFLVFLAYHHSKGTENIILAAKQLVSTLGMYNFLILAAVAYAVGHLVSTFSSIIIESLLLRKIHLFSKYHDDKEILGESLYKVFCDRFKSIFGVEVNPKTFRLCVCFVEAYQNTVYSTAVVFLTIYGMARNFVLISFVYLVWETINCIVKKQGSLCLFVLGSILVTIGFFIHYLRFYKYFKQYILNAFILTNKTEN